MAADAEATPQQAFSAVRDDGAVLLDVREPWENEEMRIPGAMLIPLGEVPQRIAEIPEGRDIYVHCRVGGRSAKAVEFLRQNGRPRAQNVAGGIDAWKEAGLPVES
jgi:sulfur-carrier protein adenylyltransferase/sulfurtransferase